MTAASEKRGRGGGGAARRWVKGKKTRRQSDRISPGASLDRVPVVRVAVWKRDEGWQRGRKRGSENRERGKERETMGFPLFCQRRHARPADHAERIDMNHRHISFSRFDASFPFSPPFSLFSLAFSPLPSGLSVPNASSPLLRRSEWCAFPFCGVRCALKVAARCTEPNQE